MNTNAVRTWLAGSGVLVLLGPFVVNGLMMLFGCSGDNPVTPEVEVAVCTGGALFQIPAGLQAAVGGIAIGAALWLKARWGKQGEAVTAGQKLFAPDVPVVPEHLAGPGNVTVDQVKEF